jgi:hypothetical protein
MRIWSVAPLVGVVYAAAGASGPAAFASEGLHIAGPHIHENLAVYFLRGRSAVGPVPLTLQEALVKDAVKLIETGNVNELEIENTGTEEVFIQAGDIVKGGKQDRMLTVSFVLPPKSGRVPIASFCVERGRWSARGAEDHSRFSSAAEAMPSKAGLLAIATTSPRKPNDPAGTAAKRAEREEGAIRQGEVWEAVAGVQRRLSRELKATVAAPESVTSLQLSLENENLKKARTAYLEALEPLGRAQDDIVGYVAVINGKFSSANLYPSNGLFRKMWAKQLAAVATEAIGEKPTAGSEAQAPPSAAAAKEFLEAAEKGKEQERVSAAGMRQETRESDHAVYTEARGPGGQWVHRSYLAK